MQTPKFKLCRIGPSGALDQSPLTISPETAAQRDPAAFLRLYEEMRLAYLRNFGQQAMALETRKDD